MWVESSNAKAMERGPKNQHVMVCLIAGTHSCLSFWAILVVTLVLLFSLARARLLFTDGIADAAAADELHNTNTTIDSDAAIERQEDKAENETSESLNDQSTETVQHGVYIRHMSFASFLVPDVCPEPEIVPFSRMVGSTEPYHIGSWAAYVCDNSVGGVIKCLSNGSWTQQPTCDGATQPWFSVASEMNLRTHRNRRGIPIAI